MRIIALTIKGARKIAALEVKLSDKPGIVPFVGMNEHGKSTVLDCIEILFKGLSACPKDFIKHGEKKAELSITFGDYTVERVITKNSNSLKINGKKGGNIQKFLNQFVNELAFNPRPFLNKKADEKLRFAMELFHLDFKIENQKIKEFTEERLLIGREIAKIGEITVVEEVEPVDLEDLFFKKGEIEKANKAATKIWELDKKEKLKKIIKFNGKQEEKTRTNKIEARKLELINEAEVKLQGKVDELQTQLIAIQKKKEVQKHVVYNLVESLPLKDLDIADEELKLKDITTVDSEIKKAALTNQEAGLYKSYVRDVKDKEDKQKEYNDYSVKIRENEKAKKKKLVDIDIPVSGLEIREDGVYHNNVFSQNWSESEGLTIAAELYLAMNPKLKAIFIDKGESYDRESLKNLQKWAVKNGIQVFITIVDDIPEKLEEGVFYIEEGSIVNQAVIEKVIPEKETKLPNAYIVEDGIVKEDPNPEILLANDNDWDENDE